MSVMVAVLVELKLLNSRIMKLIAGFGKILISLFTFICIPVVPTATVSVVNESVKEQPQLSVIVTV